MKKIIAQILFICISINVYAVTQNVTVQDHFFSPTNFTISIGDTIIWTWVNGAHSTTSLTIPTGAAGWNHDITSVSQTFIYIPSVAGSYSYKCIPHFAMGMIASFAVVCPQVTVQISATSSTTFCFGGSVNLFSSATGNPVLYQWMKNGSAISGASSSSYLATVTGNYKLSATNDCGSSGVSNTISVTVNSLPVATITPSGNVTMCLGDTTKLTANQGTGLSYQWFRNGVIISGATNKIYKAKKGGRYQVTVTKTATGCSRMSAKTIITINCRTAETIAENNLVKIYPNPSAGSFHISIADYAGDPMKVFIKDLTGNIVFSEVINRKELTISEHLGAGIYLIELYKDRELIAKNKIIKIKE